jgi:HSP20 family molecular chaperone IbpA
VGPCVDIQETDHELIVKADVPDMEMKGHDVRMENGTLTSRRAQVRDEKDRGRLAPLDGPMAPSSACSRCRTP